MNITIDEANEMKEQAVDDVCEKYNAVIEFILSPILQDKYEIQSFLTLWNEGEWEAIREEYPEFKGTFPSN